MKRIFKVETSIQVPDGTTVSPFLNSKDNTSGLPWDLLDGFSIAAGEIHPGVTSKIHVMPLVTQVTFVLSGKLEVRMKDRYDPKPYSLVLRAGQAVITEPGTFLQLHNGGADSCHVLYIVSPAYMFSMVNGNVEYDDSIVLDEGWDELAEKRWSPVKLKQARLTKERRSQASKCLAAWSVRRM